LQLRPDLSQDRDRLKINLKWESPGMARTGEIVAFDVETTGLAPDRGHRVIEIGAVREVEGYSNGQPCIAFQLRPEALRRECHYG